VSNSTLPLGFHAAYAGAVAIDSPAKAIKENVSNLEIVIVNPPI